MKQTVQKQHFPVRTLVVMAFDLVILALSFFASYAFILENRPDVLGECELTTVLAIYISIPFLTIAAITGYSTKSIGYSSRFAPQTIVASIASHIIIALIYDLIGVKFKFGVVLMAAFSGMLITISRFLQKYLYDRYINTRNGNEGKIPTLIIGAGFTGKMVYRELTEGKENNLNPVCYVDDNKYVDTTEICGIPVYGPTVLIPQLCKKYNIGMIVYAIPSSTAEQRSRILAHCRDLNCDVRIIPSLNELANEKNFFAQAQPVDVEKLLSRDAIKIDNNRVAGFVKDKVCLVTGGGGSIGSELCRQIVRMSPNRLVIVDIYENNAYEIQQELKRFGYGDDLVSVEIASVRDKEKMRSLFKKYKFDLIFHAAAHKHVPLMETNPEEAVKNNICGTYNIAHFAHMYGVKKMVLISTDKAVNPTNVMGATKRACEMVMQYMAQRYDSTTYTAVRFGNVLGSNGSVIPLFTKQIGMGGPVTVTHPDIIRYFMTIPEAVSLVLEAGTMSRGGETFVLDMGEPVKIVTLAENLIRMHGYEPYTDIPIRFCGLREGEKLFEELLMGEENLKETHNKKIFISDQLEIDCDKFKNEVEQLISVAQKNNIEETVKLLHKLVPTFKTPEEINGDAGELPKKETVKA